MFLVTLSTSGAVRFENKTASVEIMDGEKLNVVYRTRFNYWNTLITRTAIFNYLFLPDIIMLNT